MLPSVRQQLQHVAWEGVMLLKLTHLMVVLQADVASKAKHDGRAHAAQQGRHAALGQEANQASHGQQCSVGECEAEVVHGPLLGNVVKTKDRPAQRTGLFQSVQHPGVKAPVCGDLPR